MSYRSYTPEVYLSPIITQEQYIHYGPKPRMLTSNVSYYTYPTCTNTIRYTVTNAYVYYNIPALIVRIYLNNSSSNNNEIYFVVNLQLVSTSSEFRNISTLIHSLNLKLPLSVDLNYNTTLITRDGKLSISINGVTLNLPVCTDIINLLLEIDMRARKLNI